MPFTKLQFRPGINRDTTNYANEGGFYDCDKIRFFSGYPQKLGGWIKATSETFLGTCRQMWNWVTSFSDNFLALGTNQKVYLEVGGLFYDITPVRLPLPAPDQEFTFISPDTDGCIGTTDATTTITVTIASHGCFVGDFIVFKDISGPVGGVPEDELNGEHVVTSVPTTGTFTFEVTTPATSTTTGGGNSIKLTCLISPGFPIVTAGYGWGTGAWSGDSTPPDPDFGWGLASPVPVFLPQRDWWFDNFGNDLIMNIRSAALGTGAPGGGPIYYWERGVTVNPVSSLETRAFLLSDLPGASGVPTQANQVLVSQNDRHILAFGCQPYLGAASDYDPLLIRWSSQNDPGMWAPASTNSAGDLRISRGSRIVRAIPTRQEIVVFTDTHIFSLQFLGTTDVFGLQEISDNVSIIGPRCVTTVNNVTYWMGVDKFYAYDGRVQTLQTTLREYVFKDINFAQSDQIICGTNEGFNEIWWFYASENSEWIDRYVVYNHLERVWHYGTMVRTAWLDAGSRNFPFAAETDQDQNPGVLYQHEVGLNDDTLPMNSFIQSSDFDIGDGEQFMLTRRIIPDINFTTSEAPTPEVTITVRPRNFPGANYDNDPADSQAVIENQFGVYTNQIFVRARGRQMAIKVSSEDIGVFWQMGLLRLDARPDGKR